MEANEEQKVEVWKLSHHLHCEKTEFSPSDNADRLQAVQAEEELVHIWLHRFAYEEQLQCDQFL